MICLGPQTESHVEQNWILDWYFNMWTIFFFLPLFIYVGDAQLFWYSWLHSFLRKHLGRVSWCFPQSRAQHLMDWPEDLHLNLTSPSGTGLTEHAQINEVVYTCKKWCFPEAMEIFLIVYVAYVCPYLSRKALAVFHCHLQNHWSIPVPAVCFQRSLSLTFSHFSVTTTCWADGKEVWA